jgi:hypothetical protein
MSKQPNNEPDEVTLSLAEMLGIAEGEEAYQALLKLTEHRNRQYILKDITVI